MLVVQRSWASRELIFAPPLDHFPASLLTNVETVNNVKRVKTIEHDFWGLPQHTVTQKVSMLVATAYYLGMRQAKKADVDLIVADLVGILRPRKEDV